MSERTMDQGAKDRVRAALTAHAGEAARALAESVGAEHAAAEIDQDASYSVDDQSQSDEAGDLAGLTERSQASRAADLAAIEALDFSLTDIVRPGAVVGFGGQRYVVGAVADTFTADGVDYEGISADAPLAAALLGLREGDTFTFRDRQHTLELVA